MNNTDEPGASPWHAGERQLQESVGVAQQMEHFGRKVVRDYMPDQHRSFYSQLPYLVVGAVDQNGIPWATLIEGPPGFVHSPDPRSLQLDRLPADGDPVKPALGMGAAVGLLGIDLKTRRRNRMNGNINTVSSDGVGVSVVHAFGNCPQYIQLRSVEPVSVGRSSSNVLAQRLHELDEAAREIIRKADTFFLASYVDLEGDSSRRSVDVSHRGGNPGFVRVEGNVLTIPDFAGNLHFNTLGNLLLNPKAGLVFVDFSSGDVLQVAGRTELILEGPQIAAFQGAERLWTLTVEHVVLRRAVLALRWVFEGFSPNSLMTGSWEKAEGRLQADALRDQWRHLRVTRIVEESSTISSFYLEPTAGAGLPREPGEEGEERVAAGEGHGSSRLKFLARVSARYADRSHALRGNASTDAPRSALDGTRSVPGCIPTRSVGTISDRRGNDQLLGDELRAHVRRIIRQHRLNFALFLQKLRRLANRLRRAAVQQRRGLLCLGIRECGTGEQFRHVGGIGTGQFGDFLHRHRVSRPAVFVRRVISKRVQRDLGEFGHDVRVLLGKVLACDPHFKGRRAPLANLRSISQGLAGLADFTQRRRPDKRAINIATLPRRGDFCRLQVHHFDFRSVEAPMLQGTEQAVMRGGNEGCGDGLADQILRGIDAAAIAHHQCFGGVDLCRNNERHDRQITRGRRRQRAGTEVADLHVARSNGCHNFRAAIEAAPVDFLADGFLVDAVSLRDFARIDTGLVTDGEVGRLCGKRKYRRYTNCNKLTR